MTNYEKNKDDIIDILANDKWLAANKQGKICECDAINCNDCLFYNDEDFSDCVKSRTRWLNAEYIEPPVDWTKVEVDTPVLVSEDNKDWFKRYFAEYANGKVWTWLSGTTSWSNDGKNDMTPWEYAKLAEKE